MLFAKNPSIPQKQPIRVSDRASKRPLSLPVARVRALQMQWLEKQLQEATRIAHAWAYEMKASKNDQKVEEKRVTNKELD